LNSIYTDLVYIDSLDDNEMKAEALLMWSEDYLSKDITFNLSLNTMKMLDELFYKNIRFLDTYLKSLNVSMSEINSLKKFHKH
jgi:hypothetical protein